MDCDAREAARILVASKRDVEHEIERHYQLGFWGRLALHARGICQPTTSPVVLWPRDFIKECLPFSFVPGSGIPERVEKIDPEVVLSNLYSETYPIRPVDEEHKLLDWLDSTADCCDDWIRRMCAPQYSQVGDLPLYAAFEGKNRVVLYRRLGRSIRARVDGTGYPAPSNLKVRRTFPFGHYVLVCTDERFADHRGKRVRKKVLAFPDAVLPLLRAYGVRVKDRRTKFMPFSPLRLIAARFQVTRAQG